MINCTFENGNKAPLRHVVVHAIVAKDSKILLIKRAKQLTNGGKWAVPGGFVDRDETCEQAALRELKEETGLSGKVKKLVSVIDNPNRKNEDRQNIAFSYEVEAHSDQVKIQESEVEDYKWFDVNNLPPETDFAFDHYDIIQKFLDGKSS